MFIIANGARDLYIWVSSTYIWWATVYPWHTIKVSCKEQMNAECYNEVVLDSHKSKNKQVWPKYNIHTCILHVILHTMGVLRIRNNKSVVHLIYELRDDSAVRAWMRQWRARWGHWNSNRTYIHAFTYICKYTQMCMNVRLHLMHVHCYTLNPRACGLEGIDKLLIPQYTPWQL